MDEPQPEPVELSAALLDALPDGILVVDSHGTIKFTSVQLNRLSGYTAGELLGVGIDKLIPDRFHNRHDRHRARYERSGRPIRAMGSGLRIVLRARDGSEIPVDVALSPIQTRNGAMVLAAVRDARERVAVQEIGQAILAGEETGVVLATVCRLARDLAGASLATLALPDAGGTHLVVEVAEGLGEALVRARRLPVEGSLAGEAYRDGRPLNVTDAGEEARAFAPTEVAGFGPILVMPLQAGSRAFGVLSVMRRKGSEAFGPEAQKVVELFAAQASVAIEYSRVRNELRRLAIVEDRERIGRELHDGVIQSLFGVGMNLQATAAIALNPEVEERIEASVAELDTAIRDLRNYIFGLRPGLLADHQLGLAIQKLARDFEHESGLTIVAEVDAKVAANLSPIAGDVVQLVRESLSNVVRHAAAATCRVSLSAEDGQALLEIEDDGRGFDPGSTTGSGQGLRNLRDRALALKGLTEVRSAPNEGTTVRISLPI